MVERQLRLADPPAVDHTHLRLTMEIEPALAPLDAVDAVMVFTPIRTTVVVGEPKPIAVIVDGADMGLEVGARRESFHGPEFAARPSPQENVVVAVAVAVPQNRRLPPRVDRQRRFPIARRDVSGDRDRVGPLLPPCRVIKEISVCPAAPDCHDEETSFSSGAAAAKRGNVSGPGP